MVHSIWENLIKLHVGYNLPPCVLTLCHIFFIPLWKLSLVFVPYWAVLHYLRLNMFIHRLYTIIFAWCVYIVAITCRFSHLAGGWLWILCALICCIRDKWVLLRYLFIDWVNLFDFIVWGVIYLVVCVTTMLYVTIFLYRLILDFIEQW